MRQARIKIRETPAYYHVGNHVCGPIDSLPFTDDDKELGFYLLKKLSRLFLVEVISACWMGNHFHIVVYVPGVSPSLEEAVRRYNSYHKDNSAYHEMLDLSENRDRCKEIARKLIDVSEFMKAFQQQYTFIFNKRHRRKGPLWRNRFWSVLLEGPKALWDCVKYVELNPVRAGVVCDPGQYLYNSWGIYVQTKRHPFTQTFICHMRKNRLYADFLKPWTFDDQALMSDFSDEMDAVIRRERMNEKSESMHQPPSNIQEPLNFTIFLKELKQWRCGQIIGSRDFVISTASRFRLCERFPNKRMGSGLTSAGNFLCCFHLGRVSPSR